MSSFRNSKGYTIVEAVIVLGIMSILLAAAFTGYNQYVGRNRVKTAIRSLVTLKKGLNSMATACKGYPVREVSDVNDLNSILPIVDLTECQGNSVDQNADYPLIYPANNACTVDSLGNEVLPALPGSTAATKYHSSGLCHATCNQTDTDCMRKMGLNFYHTFISVSGQSCSPQYGSPSGSEFGPAQYEPGWNYVLLHGNAGTAGVDKPIGVLCGMAFGYKTNVKIVINTAGYYSRKVAEGSGVYDITGGVLPNSCPCGPWCGETAAGGRQGCCAPCTGWDDGVYYPGIGYKF